MKEITEFIIDSIDMTIEDYDLEFEYDEKSLSKKLDKLKLGDIQEFLVYFAYLSMGSTLNFVDNYDYSDLFDNDLMNFTSMFVEEQGIENEDELVEVLKNEYKKFEKLYNKFVIVFESNDEFIDIILDEVVPTDSEIKEVIGTSFSKYVDSVEISEFMREELEELVADEIYHCENYGNTSSEGITYFPNTNYSSEFYTYQKGGAK